MLKPATPKTPIVKSVATVLAPKLPAKVIPPSMPSVAPGAPPQQHRPTAVHCCDSSVSLF